MRFIDFLVLLAVYSDANRAYKRYVMEDAVKVDEFLGSKTWRDRWRIAEANGVLFPKFLAEVCFEYGGSWVPSYPGSSDEKGKIG